MLAITGFLAVIYAGLKLYPVLVSDEPVALDGSIVVALVVLGIGTIALGVDRWLDVREKQVEASRTASRADSPKSV